jgi:hypothetical protein
MKIVITSTETLNEPSQIRQGTRCDADIVVVVPQLGAPWLYKDRNGDTELIVHG